ncbi:MAG: hypothetical protein KGL48_09620 [Sphingomonadales bacterium]|nr:hypothetical protein [Sphingomonadales bacterium]MDE2570035.1 hypothetical protein [Sphingomonadales bacterium]
MVQAAYPTVGLDSIGAILGAELAASDRVAENNGVILRHLLRSDDHSVFSDEVIARVRGMLLDLSRQIVVALAEAAGHPDPHAWADEASDGVVDVLGANHVLLAHLHALALEFHLTCRLESERALDPVLSPLLQAQIASPLPDVATVAMKFLSAQARFCQSQRRMELPLGELPGDLFRAVMLTLRAQAGDDAEADTVGAKAEQALRARHEGRPTRGGLAADLLGAMGAAAAAALSIEDAGVALFLSALTLGSRKSRDAAMMATTDSQLPRLVLQLAACGLKPDAVAAQFAVLHPDIQLPDGIEALHADLAAALLEQSAGVAEY